MHSYRDYSLIGITMVHFTLLLLLPVYASAVTTGITSCESYTESYSEKVTVDIAGCPTTSKDKPCVVHRTDRIQGTLSWIAEKGTASVSFMCETEVDDIFVPIELEQDDICSVLQPNKDCQLVAKQKYTIKPTLIVDKLSPLGTRPMEFSLYDDDQNMIFCVRGYVNVTEK